jgi:undecaprenyl-diphosphatase
MLWLKIIVSVLPAIVIGWPLDNLVEQYMYKAVPIALMLILYGVLFLLIERRNRNRRSRVTRLSRITWKDALIVGLFQVLAIIPGTSRSGATIIGGILIGLARPIAAEYTFFLAIPTMLGASVLKVAKFGGHFTAVEGGVLAVGMIVAFLVSMVAIRFLMQYIRKHDFKVFGWYRIALGILVLILTAAGVLSNTLT